MMMSTSTTYIPESCLDMQDKPLHHLRCDGLQPVLCILPCDILYMVPTQISTAK